MHGAVIIGPGLPGGAAAPARTAFQGASFRAHVELADRLGLPTFYATPSGPVPADTVVEPRRRWPAAKLAAAVIPWALASEHVPILALAEDAEADAWRRAVGSKMRAPLLGLTPVQRASLVRLLATGGDLPAWAPGELDMLRQKPAPSPMPAVAAKSAEDEHEGQPQRQVVRLPVIEQEAEVGRLLYPEAARLSRPRTRSECVDGPRPCPWVGCRHNLFLEVTVGEGLAFREPGREPWDVDPASSCALDVVDAHPGGMTFAEIGEMFQVTAQRVRQIEIEASATVGRRVKMTQQDVRELGDPGGMWTDLVASG